MTVFVTLHELIGIALLVVCGLGISGYRLVMKIRSKLRSKKK